MEGVSIYSLKQISVPNGDVFHILKNDDISFKGFGEAYFSQIEAGKIKGWKRHNEVTLNLVVPIGEIKFIIYDDRINSSSYGQFEEYILSSINNYCRLTIEPGLWLAFMGLGTGTSVLLNIINKPHSPIESDKKDLHEIAYDFEL